MSQRANPATGPALADRWPHLFTFPVPLKVGIHLDFRELSDPPCTRTQFARFVARWVRQPEYVAALEKAKHRYGLDGSMHPVRPWE